MYKVVKIRMVKGKRKMSEWISFFEGGASPVIFEQVSENTRVRKLTGELHP